MAPPGPVAMTAAGLAGQVMEGGVVSGVTVTLKGQDTVLAGFAASVAVQVTVVTPTVKAEPEAGVQTTVGAVVSSTSDALGRG